MSSTLAKLDVAIRPPDPPVRLHCMSCAGASRIETSDCRGGCLAQVSIMLFSNDRKIRDLAKPLAALAARGESQTPSKPALFRHLCVAKLRNTQGIAIVRRLDLTKNHSLSLMVHFHHGLLVQLGSFTRTSTGLRTNVVREEFLHLLLLPNHSHRQRKRKDHRLRSSGERKT